MVSEVFTDIVGTDPLVQGLAGGVVMLYLDISLAA